MGSELISNLKERYKVFMTDLDIKDNGILGKISNLRYKEHKLRFSGFPYIGCKYENAKKKILFVGLDIGIDELREEDTFHDLNSRREVIAGSVQGCTTLGYNDHISGTYITSLFLLQNEYLWGNAWKELNNIKDSTSKSTINSLRNSLPLEVLDYVALTNVHKFVSLCRGCDINKKKPECFSESCLEEHKIKNRSGSNNRKWYNKNEEINMLLDEINILQPDLVYFQGSAAKLPNEVINKINLYCDVCIEYHPSAWNVGANKPNYASQINIRKKKL